MQKISSLLAKQVHKDKHSHLVGLIGDPAEGWPSINIYNAAFDALGMDWHCVPLPISDHRLREALLGLRALGFAGAELADHHQGVALNVIEELSPAARAIGAVKIVTVNQDGQLTGDNLRWRAFMAALRSQVSSLKALRPLVIGAGRAARPIVYALTREGVPLTIVDARIERAVNLVHDLRHVLDDHSFSIYRWPQDLALLAAHANLIVNTASPEMGDYSWPEALRFPTDALVCDLDPAPDETYFLDQARASGALTINGLSLLIYEAALAIEMWTEHPRPIKVMKRVVEETLMPETIGSMTWLENEITPATLPPRASTPVFDLSPRPGPLSSVTGLKIGQLSSNKTSQMADALNAILRYSKTDEFEMGTE